MKNSFPAMLRKLFLQIAKREQKAGIFVGDRSRPQGFRGKFSHFFGRIPENLRRKRESAKILNLWMWKFTLALNQLQRMPGSVRPVSHQLRKKNTHIKQKVTKNNPGDD